MCPHSIHSTNERDSWQCHYRPPQKRSSANVNHCYSTDRSSPAVRSFRNFPCFPVAHAVSKEWHPPLNHGHWGQLPATDSHPGHYGQHHTWMLLNGLLVSWGRKSKSIQRENNLAMTKKCPQTDAAFALEFSSHPKLVTSNGAPCV